MRMHVQHCLAIHTWAEGGGAEFCSHADGDGLLGNSIIQNAGDPLPALPISRSDEDFEQSAHSSPT